MSEAISSSFYDFTALPQRKNDSKRRRREIEESDKSLFISKRHDEEEGQGESATTIITGSTVDSNTSTRKQQRLAGAMTESMSTVIVCENVDEIVKLETFQSVWDSEQLQTFLDSSPLSTSSPTITLPDTMHDKWEYLDHTADVLVHSWGETLAETFGQSALALWSHIVDRSYIEYKSGVCFPRIITAFGKDLIDLLFNFLDACLYAYGSDYFLCSRIKVIYLGSSSTADVIGGNILDRKNDEMLSIQAYFFGELFNEVKHSSYQGTEVKAITYSAMQIFLEDGIVIRAGSENEDEGRGETQEMSAKTSQFDKNDFNRPKGERKGKVDAYVVLDI
jgi:SHS2 domain-containing protein